jgi:ABC-type siderophore export system fused ATPase/permease subunit
VGYVVLVAGAAETVAGRQIAAARLCREFVDHLRQKLHGALLAMAWPAVSRLRLSDLNHGVTQVVDSTRSGVEFLLNLGGSVVQLIVAAGVVATLAPSLIALALLSALLLWPLGSALNRNLSRLG